MRPAALRATAAASLAALALAPAFLPEFYVTLLNYIGLSSLVALGLVLLTGVGGLTSFGQAAFVGLGAYTTAVLSTAYGMSPWANLAIALAITAVIALLIGLLTLRLSGHYLPLSTIAWGISLYFLFGNFELLGGQTGISNLPALNFFGLRLDSGRSFYYLIWFALLLALLAVHNLLDSRPGRAIRALKRGSLMAEAFGVDTARLKIVIFIYAALLAALSGWLYAHLLRFVNPTPFGINIGIEYLFMAVIGGASHVWGAVLGATILTLAKQWLQDWLPRLIGQDGNYEMIVFGVLMVLLLQRARDGVMPLLGRLLPAGPATVAPPAAELLPIRPRPAAGEALLEALGAEKHFGGLVAVNALSFGMRGGEILGLIGPNGAGKSTMFNLITGVLPLTAGEIRFRGRRIDGLSSREIARNGIARTFQHVNLIPTMSVLDNVALGAHLRGRRGVFAASLRTNREEEARLRFEAARQLERVGLGEHLREQAGSLPLGQQRILEIARALCADPVLLLLDEPGAGLRYKEKEALSTLLRKLRSEGISVLLVEHDMDLVMNLVDRLVVMEFGQKLAEGDPGSIQEDPRVLQAYLGERGMSAALLEVRDLRVAYGKVEALHGLSLNVPEGRIVTVIGPNGAGKSTLLNSLAGLLDGSGDVILNGKSLAGVSTEARVAEGLVLVPEKRELFGAMTVEDNLVLGAFSRLRRRGTDVQASLKEVYRRFPRLEERRAQYAATLSGGERQMLALGRALMGQPKVLMLDEPSLGLAPIIVRNIFHIISELRATGVSILLVEQNARAALQVADYGYVLETGDQVLEGTGAELSSNPRVVETYLGLAGKRGTAPA